MPKAHFLPNSAVFKQIAAGRKLTTLKREWRVSIHRIRQLFAGKPVSEMLISDLADRLNCSVTDLILQNKNTFISNTPEYFQRIRFGYYIDNRFNNQGTATWYKESVSLHVVESSTDGVINVTGTIINDLNEKFTVSGTRLGDHHFSISGSSEPSSLGLDGMFSLHVGDVLCGIWSGINHLGLDIGVYRMFLSPHELTLEDLQTLTKTARIVSVVSTDKIGWIERDGPG